MERFLVAGWAALLVSSFTSAAWAEDPKEAPTATAPAAATDVVRLKSGGLLRGTISELVPGDTVTIVTVSGQTRAFPMAEVEYAGPASEAPTKAAPPAEVPPAEAPRPESKNKPYVTVHAAEAHLHLESTPPGLTFHRQSGSATAITYGKYGGFTEAESYERLCTAPCDITLPAGTETLAVSRSGRTPVVAGPVTFPAGNSRLNGTLQSRLGLRIAGYVIAGVSGAAGLTLMLVGGTRGATDINNNEGPDMTLVLAGGGLMLGGVLVGTILAVQRDRASIQVGQNYAPPLPHVTGLAFGGRL